MYILLFAGLASLFFLHFWTKNSLKIIRVRGLLFPLIIIAFVFCLIVFSDSSVKAAASGLNVWLQIVFPSLFPFLVASELLKSTGLVRAIGIMLEPIMYPLFKVPGCGSFAFLMGTTSGYPVGAKITSLLKEEKILSKTQAERLIAFSNNSGPLFIIGAVSVGMFNSPRLGPLLLSCHIAASITVGILFRFYGKDEKSTISGFYKGSLLRKLKKEILNSNNNNFKLGEQMGSAIKNSIMTLLSIGGFIILFSTIIEILFRIGIIHTLSDALSVFTGPFGIHKNIVSSLLGGFFEVTTGIKMISSIENASILQKVTATSIIMGWAGLSVHSQVISIIKKTGLSSKPYLVGKLLHGAFSGVYTFTAVKVSDLQIVNEIPSFSQFLSEYESNWSSYLHSSIKLLAFCILAFLIAGLLAYVVHIMYNLTVDKS